jgi:hypothetical protein
MVWDRAVATWQNLPCRTTPVKESTGKVDRSIKNATIQIIVAIRSRLKPNCGFEAQTDR